VLLHILSFLLRDEHFALQLCDAAPLDAAALMQRMLAMLSDTHAAHCPYGLEQALQVLSLLNHAALPWPFMLSFLRDLLTHSEQLLLHIARESCNTSDDPASTAPLPAVVDTAALAMVARHFLALLASLWQRGNVWFLEQLQRRPPHHQTIRGPDSSRSNGNGSAPYESAILVSYQRLLGAVLRIDWTASCHTQLLPQQADPCSAMDCSAATDASPPVPVSEVSDTAASLSAVYGIASLLHAHALHLVHSWPHPSRFHAGIVPLNGAGLVPAIDAADIPRAAAMGMCSTTPYFGDETNESSVAPSSPACSSSLSPPSADCAPPLPVEQQPVLFGPGFTASVVLDEGAFLRLSLDERAKHVRQWQQRAAIYGGAQQADEARERRRRRAVPLATTIAATASTIVKQGQEEGGAAVAAFVEPSCSAVASSFVLSSAAVATSASSSSGSPPSLLGNNSAPFSWTHGAKSVRTTAATAVTTTAATLPAMYDVSISNATSAPASSHVASDVAADVAAIGIADVGADGLLSDVPAWTSLPPPLARPVASTLDIAAAAWSINVDALLHCSSRPSGSAGERRRAALVNKLREQHSSSNAHPLGSNGGNRRSLSLSPEAVQLLRAEIKHLRAVVTPVVQRCMNASLQEQLAAAQVELSSAAAAQAKALAAMPFLPLSRACPPTGVAVVAWTSSSTEDKGTAVASSPAAPAGSLRAAAIETASAVSTTNTTTPAARGAKSAAAVVPVSESILSTPSLSAPAEPSPIPQFDNRLGLNISAVADEVPLLPTSSSSNTACASSRNHKAALSVTDWSTQIKFRRVPGGSNCVGVGGKSQGRFRSVAAVAEGQHEHEHDEEEEEQEERKEEQDDYYERRRVAVAATDVAMHAIGSSRASDASPAATSGRISSPSASRLSSVRPDLPPVHAANIPQQQPWNRDSVRRYDTLLRKYDTALGQLFEPKRRHSASTSATAASAKPLLASSLQHVPSLPSRSFHLPLRRNVASEDQPEFKFAPWMGDDTAPTEFIDPTLFRNLESGATKNRNKENDIMSRSAGGATDGGGTSRVSKKRKRRVVNRKSAAGDGERKYNFAAAPASSFPQPSVGPLSRGDCDKDGDASMASSFSSESDSNSSASSSSSSSPMSADSRHVSPQKLHRARAASSRSRRQRRRCSHNGTSGGGADRLQVAVAPDVAAETSRLVDEVLLRHLTRWLSGASAGVNAGAAADSHQSQQPQQQQEHALLRVLVQELGALQISSAREATAKLDAMETAIQLAFGGGHRSNDGSAVSAAAMPSSAPVASPASSAAAISNNTHSSRRGTDWEPADPSSALDSFSSLFCRRCFLYDCFLHGPKQPRARDTVQLRSSPPAQFPPNGAAAPVAVVLSRALASAPKLKKRAAALPPHWKQPIPLIRTSAPRIKREEEEGSKHNNVVMADDPLFQMPCSKHCFLHTVAASELRIPWEPTASASAPATPPIRSELAQQHEHKHEHSAVCFQSESKEPVCDENAHSPLPPLSPVVLSVSPITGRALLSSEPASRSSASPRPGGPFTVAEQTLLRQMYFVARSVLHSSPDANRFLGARGGRPPPHLSLLSSSPSPQQHLPCQLVALLGNERTCDDVAAFLRSEAHSLLYHGEVEQIGLEQKIAAAAAQVGPRPELHAVAGVDICIGGSGGEPRMSRADLDRRIKQINVQFTDLPLMFRPCDHEGPCGGGGDNGAGSPDPASKCGCMARHHFCEPSCGCPPDCSNRFRGCRCIDSRCGTQACLCFQAQRECDPNVCRSCQCELELDPALAAQADAAWRAAHAGLSAAEMEALPPPPPKQRRCTNVNLLSGRSQPLLLGRSATHGWGCFLGAAPPVDGTASTTAAAASSGDAAVPVSASSSSSAMGVAKHRFVGEYRGEVISHEEADRRGSIYDFRNVSFLFNLNDARVVDATRAGNKLKYANHAGEGEGGGGGGGGEQPANLYPRIVLSQGELRIGMFARRKIMPGDELLFNYHWTHESAWTSNARRKQQQQLQQQTPQ
jgi:hypothetical protein